MVVVVDYGMGNLRSVSKALEALGADVMVSSDPSLVASAAKLVLPGVGAFGDAVGELHDRGLFEPVRGYLGSGRPFLGICLGLQLLLESSEESPGVAGLGHWKGRVRLFQDTSVKVPHMGWNQVELRGRHPLLSGLRGGTYFYFVHSYYGVLDDPSPVAGWCRYGNADFAAVLAEGAVAATQFHPEKSQQAGLRLLKNFVDS